MTTITPPLIRLLQQPVVPVLSFESVREAIPICAGLVEAGLPVLELTLRTPRALEVVAAVRAEVADAVVAVGTVLDGPQARAAVAAAGCRRAGGTLSRCGKSDLSRGRPSDMRAGRG